MKRALVSLLLTLCLLCTGLVCAAEEVVYGDVVAACAVAETLQEGQTITGLRIEYPSEIAAGVAKTSNFAVEGYTLIGIYVNNSGEWEHAESAGKYLFLQFAYSTVPGYSAGKTLQYAGGSNSRMPTILSIRQNANLTLIDGTVVRAGAFTNTGADINVLVDDFIPVTYTDSTGFEVSYRFFIPEGYEDKSADLEPLPVVLFLHGAGESGLNNETQIEGNPSALEFAKPEAQAEHPCFVIAPQSPFVGWAAVQEDGTYGMSPATAAMIEALKGIVEEYAVDADRLYCTGLSMGGRGTWAANIANPDLFAAMITIASCDIYTDEQLALLLDKPIWILLAEDETEERITNFGKVVEQMEGMGAVFAKNLGSEGWNGYLRGYAAEQEALDQIKLAEELGTNKLYTYYLPGTVIPSSHWTWMAAYNNAAIRDWLFSQSK